MSRGKVEYAFKGKVETTIVEGNVVLALTIGEVEIIITSMVGEEVIDEVIGGEEILVLGREFVEGNGISSPSSSEIYLGIRTRTWC